MREMVTWTARSRATAMVKGQMAAAEPSAAPRLKEPHSLSWVSTRLPRRSSGTSPRRSRMAAGSCGQDLAGLRPGRSMHSPTTLTGVDAAAARLADSSPADYDANCVARRPNSSKSVSVNQRSLPWACTRYEANPDKSGTE